MDRRSFFKSTTLWLAGLIGLPNIESIEPLDDPEVVDEAEVKFLGDVISIECPHPTEPGKFIKVGELRSPRE